MSEQFESLQSVVTDPRFPEVDTLLRQGVHIDVDDIELYEFLLQAQGHLDAFYDGYDCRLVHAPEQYFFLVSEGTLLGQSRLSRAQMLVGQTLALMRMDPAHLAQAGRVTTEQLLTQLEMLVPAEGLFRLLAPRSRGKDRATDQRKVREAVQKALRGLDRLRFVDLDRDDTIGLRRSLMRFADPVRGRGDVQAALEQMVARGEAAVEDEEE